MPSATPAQQLKPRLATAWVIFFASSASPPKYRAGPRAAMAQLPGPSTSTCGQNSSTALTTCSNASPSGADPASCDVVAPACGGQSGQHNTSTRDRVLPVVLVMLSGLSSCPARLSSGCHRQAGHFPGNLTGDRGDRAVGSGQPEPARSRS